MSSDTYRILVRSSKRLSGHEYDFLYDASPVTTARDFVGTTWMCAVEWCDAVEYSEYESDFSRNEFHPSCLLLQCPTLLQANAWESWTAKSGTTLALLQSYASTGVYGITADLPYVRRDTLGVVVQGDLLNQLGHFHFVVQQGPGYDNGGVVSPCLEPTGLVFGGDFSFSLVFWRIDVSPERPMGDYDVYKLWLCSSDRVAGGTPGDCIIPIRARSRGMQTGRWEVAVEAWSQLRHDTLDLADSWSLVSRDFVDANSNSQVLASFPRTRVVGATTEFGLRLSTKPPTRDTVGIPVRTPIDALQTVHLALRDSVSGEALEDPGLVGEWMAVLVFYKVN